LCKLFKEYIALNLICNISEVLAKIQVPLNSQKSVDKVRVPRGPFLRCPLPLDQNNKARPKPGLEYN